MASAFSIENSSAKTIGLAVVYLVLKFFLRAYSPWMLTMIAVPFILIIANADQRRGLIAGALILLINTITTNGSAESGLIPNICAGFFALGLGALPGYFPKKSTRDITKMPATKNHEKMLQSILLHTDTAVTMMDRNGRIILNEVEV